MKRFLLLALLGAVVLAHKEVADEAVTTTPTTGTVNDPDYLEIPAAATAQDDYTGPKDFEYCKVLHKVNEDMRRLHQVYL